MCWKECFSNARAVLRGFIKGELTVQVSLPLETGLTTPMRITVNRTRQTKDGLFGRLVVTPVPFFCFTVENLKDAIPAGTYPVEFTWSPEFNQTMPLIDVPGRSAIRIHPANWPNQLLGCIAVGDKEEPDAVDNSRVTFNQLFSIIKNQKDLTIQVNDIPKEDTMDPEKPPEPAVPEPPVAPAPPAA